MQVSSPGRLITIAFSHYCDKARWGLDRFAIPYVEEPHLPVFHALATLPSGARRSVPALILPDRVLCDSTDILRYADELAGGNQLYPQGAMGKECSELVAYFDSELGPHSRRLFYFHVLPDREASVRTFLTAGVAPRWEQSLCGLLFPITRAVMRRLMRIDAEGARLSRLKIDGVFARVAELLRDGRPYLLGDRFTAADLTFAALAAPSIAPAEYGFPLPSLADIPAGARAVIEELRPTPAGLFASRIYATERRRVVSPS